MNKITFSIVSQPFAKQRPRFAKGGRVYTPPKTVFYEKMVAIIAKEAMKEKKMIIGAVKVKIIFSISMPKSFNIEKKRKALRGEIYPTSRPDLDNYVKALLDGMNNIVYQDDSQVVILEAKKIYAKTSIIEVYISEL